MLFMFKASTFRRYSSSSTAADLISSPNLLHLLHLASLHCSPRLTRQTHALIISSNLTQNLFLASKLVSAYAAANSRVTESRLVFNSARQKPVALWNSLINGCVKNRLFREGLRVYNEMCCYGLLPDGFTLATVSKACGEVGDLRGGRSVHGVSVQIGFVSDTVLSNSLIAMYCGCGEFGESRKVFEEMPGRNVGSWNALISGYVNLRNCCFDMDLREIVDKMTVEGLRPDGFTVSSLLPLCGREKGEWDFGRELHGYVVRNGLDSGGGSYDVHLGCCLIDMYSKSNRVAVGRRVFDRVKGKNVFVWTAMINGYVQGGIFDEGLVLFRNMQVREGIKPNKVSLVSILPACSLFAGLRGGKQIHGFTIRMEMNHDTALCNALVDMYAKCGSLNSARKIFEDGLFLKDEISWSAMISGYGLHGMAEEAISLFNQMLNLGNKPDIVTIVGVLSSCGRSGLTKEGLHIYNLMTSEYGVNPTTEICACVVDILGRSGRLDEALAFINNMPVEPGPSVWGALVSASVSHGNFEMQELAYRFLLELEPENPSNYVSLSNLHASSKRWEAVAELRMMMKQRGIRKTPGCSWISISGKTYSFVVSDKVHPLCDSIYEMLDDLVSLMKGIGYSNDFEYLGDF